MQSNNKYTYYNSYTAYISVTGPTLSLQYHTVSYSKTGVVLFPYMADFMTFFIATTAVLQHQ